MRRKIDSYLGFAKKSRGLISGYNSCMDGMMRRKVRLLILAEDLAENSAEKLSRLANAQGVPVHIYGTKEMLSRVTGEIDRGIFGITNEHLAKAVLQEIERGGLDA